MARVDLAALTTALGKLFADTITAAISKDTVLLNTVLYAGTPFVRPGRYVKRRWKRAGKPASLKQWARVMEPWDPVVRAWLSGDPYVDKHARAEAKRRNFGLMYGMAPNHPNLQQIPRK